MSTVRAHRLYIEFRELELLADDKFIPTEALPIEDVYQSGQAVGGNVSPMIYGQMMSDAELFRLLLSGEIRCLRREDGLDPLWFAS